MTHSVIEDSTPLKPNYLPPKFVDREEEQAVLTDTFSDITNVGSQNLVVDGPAGVGKTHLVLKQIQELPDTANTCYVSCRRDDTQYKILSEIHRTLFDEEISEGYHTAMLQRELEHRLVLGTVIVLDDLDFLLLNDGDDVLYYLSREIPRQVTLVLIAANDAELESRLEERTYSSLHPRRLAFEPYTTEELFEILAARARNALAPQSLHRKALRRIAATVSDPRIGLYWLRTAAEAVEDTITEPLVKQVRLQAYHRYVDAQLREFTIHHRLAYQAIEDLTLGETTSVRTGQIYERYRQLCDVFAEDPLSQRRLSDFLKHLELLDLIDVEYHYGGERGRTREIHLRGFFTR